MRSEDSDTSAPAVHHARQQLLELRMVGRRRRDQADPLAQLEAFFDAFHQVVDVAVPHGQRRIAGQAEAAAARAATGHLDQEHVAQLDVGLQHRRHRLKVVHVARVEARHWQRQVVAAPGSTPLIVPSAA